MWCSILLAAAVLRINVGLAFSPPVAFGTRQTQSTTGMDTNTGLIESSRTARTLLSGKKGDDEDLEPGMAEAFRQLDNLQSLGGEKTEEEKSESTNKPKPIDASDIDVKSPESASPEKEVQLYKEMVQELEETDEDDLYSNVLKDMGGTPTDKKKQTPPPLKPPSIPVDDGPEKTTEDFMNQALDEALKEVKIKNPSSVDSILDDKEIMAEIEAIFERGNEKLMESLEEMRREQQELAKASANKNAKNQVGASEENAARLAQAEASMEVMLKRVNQETAEVEKAVADLQAAQEQMDSGFISKLRNGGIPKQAAFAGLLLFSFRSIIDSIGSLSDESLLPVALIQGAIAIVCALIFFFL